MQHQFETNSYNSTRLYVEDNNATTFDGVNSVVKLSIDNKEPIELDVDKVKELIDVLNFVIRNKS
jgi:hypothetical protein